MINIKRLLSKNSWTGRELGRIALTDSALAVQRKRQKKDNKPLIDENLFQKMLSTVTDPAEVKVYEGYVAIHDWLNIFFNMAQGQLQQAQLQYRTLDGYIREATLAEDIYSYLSLLPAVMTKKQLDETVAAGVEAYLTDENGEDIALPFFELLVEAIGYYLRQLREEPTKPNPLKAVKKKYLKEPVKSKLVLDRWNTVTKQGYYTLADGRRSDQMAKKDFLAAVEQTAFTELKQELGKYLNEGNSIEAAAGLTDFQGAKWHDYTEPPKDLTKWKVVEQVSMRKLYPASLDGKNAFSKSNYLTSMNDFREEFSYLVDTLLKELDRKYSLDLAKIPVSEWHKTGFSLRYLYEKDFLAERQLAENSFLLTAEDSRAAANGIAILQPQARVKLDKNGYYIEPKISSSLSDYTLEGFFTESPKYALNVQLVESSRRLFLSSYYFLLGYNHTIDRIADLHGVPDVRAFKVNIPALTDRIDALNSLIPQLYKRIIYTPYKDKQLQKKKLQVLKDYFQPLKYQKVTLPAANIEEADEFIANFSGFYTAGRGKLIQLLFIRPDDSEGNENE